MQSKLKKAAIAGGALLLIPALSGFRYTGFNDTAARVAGNKATTWLKTQQLADGSFEVAGFPGFETADAILAIAENSQQQAAWNGQQARIAVNATKRGNNSAMHAIDDLADSGPNAGQAAKVVVLVTKPLSLNPKKFDPDGDGPANLRAVIDAGYLPNGSYGAFNATLYAAIAKRILGKVPPQTLTYIRNAQEASGGWNYAGDKTGNFADIDTTALAIEALVAARVKKDDPDLRQGLAYLGRQNQASGAWQSFGSDDPNSTAVAMLAVTSAGFDPTTRCWRDTVSPTRKGNPFASPSTWLRSQQQANGRIVSPSDSFGINTLATTQSIQALRRGWIPVKPLGKQKCVA